MCTRCSTFNAAHFQYHHTCSQLVRRFNAGYCLQTICISCVFSTCCVILRTLRDPHHLWRDMLTICSTTRQSPRQLHHCCRRFARVTSCPSSAELTSLFSHTTTHRVQRQDTLVGAFCVRVFTSMSSGSELSSDFSSYTRHRSPSETIQWNELDSDVTSFSDTHKPLEIISITILRALCNRLDLLPFHLHGHGGDVFGWNTMPVGHGI